MSIGRHFVLLDACVAAAHFAPKSTQSVNLRTRASTLLKGVSVTSDTRFLIPNFCIAEVFAVFEKYRWGRTWNKHVKRENALSKSEFDAARAGFGDAIHNGSKILQVELNRYHVLCVDLIAPVNNAYKFNRARGSGSKGKMVAPAKTYDMLVAAMGLWLTQQHGLNNLTLVTGDKRIANVVARAKSLSLGRPMKAHLTERARALGLTYGPSIYPEVIDLTSATKTQLRSRFPEWVPAW